MLVSKLNDWADTDGRLFACSTNSHSITQQNKMVTHTNNFVRLMTVLCIRRQLNL